MQQRETYILSIDLGTSGCKVGLVTPTGRVDGWGYSPVPLTVVDEIGAEQEPAAWWRALIEASRVALAQVHGAAEQVAGLCCSTQGEGTVAVDRSGRVLHNAITWLDMRGAAHVQGLMKSPFKLAGYDALKLMHWLRLTGGAPALSGKDPAGHMLFIRDAMPEVYAKTYKFLNVLDYLNMRLTGRFVATPDSILTSWVTDNRDLGAIRYDDRLIAMSGIAREKFPELVRPTDVIGPILPDVAEALGLRAGVPVVAGAIDNSAAAIGAGTIADYDAHLYVGTSSWIAAHVPFKKTSPRDQITSVPCARDDRYLMMAMQSCGANNITFLKDRIVFHDDGLIDAEPDADTYRVLDEIAARHPAGADGVIYLPWLFGERSPVDNPSLRAGLFNLGMGHNRETLVRAVFEGVALNTRWMMKPTTKFMGRPIVALTIIGGGALSDAWCQIFADVLGVPIRRPVDPIKANVRGAASIGAAGLGLIRLDEVASHTQIERVFEPNPAHRQIYDDRFDLFLDLYRRLSPIYKRLNGQKGKAYAQIPS